MSGIISTGKGLQLNVSITCDVERTEKHGPGGTWSWAAFSDYGNERFYYESGRKRGVTPISDEHAASQDTEGASVLANEKKASALLTRQTLRLPLSHGPHRTFKENSAIPPEIWATSRTPPGVAHQQGNTFGGGSIIIRMRISR